MSYFGGDFGRYLVNSGRFCDGGAVLWRGNPLLGPNKFPYVNLMKIEWFVVNVTAVRSLDRAEHAILGVILAGHFFGQSR